MITSVLFIFLPSQVFSLLDGWVGMSLSLCCCSGGFDCCDETLVFFVLRYCVETKVYS